MHMHWRTLQVIHISRRREHVHSVQQDAVQHGAGSHTTMCTYLSMPCCLTHCCSALIASAPYTALLGLAKPGACRQGGAGDGLLAGLSSTMQKHLLR
jgi:hypothetical protein